MPISRRRRLLFALVPLAVLVGGAEVGLRLLGAGECRAPAPAPGDWREMQGDPDLLWSLVPDRELEMDGGVRARIGPDGLRTQRRPSPRDPRTRRIVTLGDSGVFGWGVPEVETWQNQLEVRLASAFPGTAFEVLNLGVPGYSTVQSLRLMERIGWRFAPDVVLGANQFSDCNIDVFQDEVALSVVNPDRSPVHRALRTSRAYCLLWSTWAGWYAHDRQARNRVLMPGVSGSTWVEERLDTFIEQSRVPLGDYRQNLEILDDATRAHGARLVLVELAQEWDVGVWTVPHRDRPGPGEVLPWTPYRAAMREIAADRDLPLVSMPEALAAAPEPHERLFLDPVHPSADGARIMAEALAAFFVARPDLLGLAPPPGGAGR